MKTSRILTLGVVSMLMTPLAAMAVTETWDGGGADDNVSTGLNWADNSAPVSDLVNTDLVFAGAVRLIPNFAAAFSADGITFDNTAGFFQLIGARLDIGDDGILNNDAQLQVITNAVDFSGVATSSIGAASGGLTFTGTVTLPAGTLTVAGLFETNFGQVVGTSANTLVKQGAGTMTWSPIIPTPFDVNINAGTLAMGSDGVADVFGSTSTIAINPTGLLVINEELTLDGAKLTRASQAGLQIKPDALLKVQNGGDAVISGAFEGGLGSNLTVTGVGSTFSTTSTLTFRGDSITVSAGGSISTGTGAIELDPTSGISSMIVSDIGSSVSGGNLTLSAERLFNTTAMATFSNGSSGAFSQISVSAEDADDAAALNIESGAVVSGSGLLLADDAANLGTATVTTTGAGSMLSLTGAVPSVIGAASGSSGTLAIVDGGTFESGTGLTTVKATGLITIDDGTFNSNGNLTIDGGQLTRDSGGVLTLDAGTTLDLRNGGEVVITGGFSNTTASTILLVGSGSTLSTTSFLTVAGGSTLSVQFGSDVSVGENVNVGTSGNGTIMVSDAGSSLTGRILDLGTGGVGSATFRIGSTGSFTEIRVDDSFSTEGGGTLNVLSGAAVTGTLLTVAEERRANTGTVTVDGVNSQLTLTGAATATIGAETLSTGRLEVRNSGTFTGGTGLATVNATGTIAISGGTMNVNGNLALEGGRLMRDAAGVFNFAPGHTFGVRGGGDAIFLGAYETPSATTVNVSEAGSTFSTSTDLTIGGGSIVNILGGGSLSAGTAILASLAGSGTATINGAGSSFQADALRLGQNANAGILTFSNGSTGAFDSIEIDVSVFGGTEGTLNIQSGASVSAIDLEIASTAVTNTGTLLVTGAGSALTLSDTATIGAASNSVATVTIENGGVFTTGTGLTTVNATGDLNINAGGTMIVRGDMLVQSALDIDDGGTVILGESATPAPVRNDFADAGLQSSEMGGWLTPHGSGASTDFNVVPEPGVSSLLLLGVAALFRRRTG